MTKKELQNQIKHLDEKLCGRCSSIDDLINKLAKKIDDQEQALNLIAEKLGHKITTEDYIATFNFSYPWENVSNTQKEIRQRQILVPIKKSNKK